MFGKTLLQYVRFQRMVLGLILVVGLARLVLSLAGVPNSQVKFLSMTVVVAGGVFYYGIRVQTSGFGGYKQLLPLLAIQSVLANSIAILGILLARFGLPNIFAAPEYGGRVRTRFHILGHVVVGMIVAPLVGWLIASVTMWVTRKLASRHEPVAG